MSDKRYHDKIEKLRNPERVERFEMPRVIDAVLDGLTAKRMLDIGTGSGLFAEAFLKRGIAATGTDINPQMIDAARSAVPEGRFETAPAEKQPFDDNTFDLVFFGCLLHEVDDPVKTLTEAKRLAIKRIAVLEYPYREQPFGPPMHHRLRPEQVDAFAAQAGLKGVRMLALTHVTLYLMDIQP